MSDQRLKQVLTRRADMEIPETMDLRNSLHAAIQNERSAYQTIRLIRFVIAVLLLLITATAAYALYQTIQPDPGIEAVQNENLVVQFDETHTLQRAEGTSPSSVTVDVTLDYAYADANRITVVYHLVAQPSDAGLELFSNPLLSGSDGKNYIWLLNSSQFAYDPATSTASVIMSFDASSIAAAPEMLDLTLTLDVAYTTPEMRENNPNGMLFAGRTSFDLSLPFNPGQTIPIEQVVTSDDLAVQVERAVIAPSLTRVDVCYDPARLSGEEWLAWEAVISLSIDGETVIDEQPAEIAGFETPDAPCRTLTIRNSLVGRDGRWVLTIHQFRNRTTGELLEGEWAFSFDVG